MPSFLLHLGLEVVVLLHIGHGVLVLLHLGHGVAVLLLLGLGLLFHLGFGVVVLLHHQLEVVVLCQIGLWLVVLIYFVLGPVGLLHLELVASVKSAGNCSEVVVAVTVAQASSRAVVGLGSLSDVSAEDLVVADNLPPIAGGHLLQLDQANLVGGEPIVPLLMFQLVANGHCELVLQCSAGAVVLGGQSFEWLSFSDLPFVLPGSNWLIWLSLVGTTSGEASLQQAGRLHCQPAE